ncbi:hypothetical protein PUN28_004935 [Cardiocondyla obscurior]|uniref:Uncharacterized protein n=1 Tax=Cardiocondyla obscurior TaxID=286306 RepID=A0AAW2GH35_9HYME
MKCLILLVILAVAQYREVTGAPQQVINRMPLYNEINEQLEEQEFGNLFSILLNTIKFANPDIKFSLDEAIKHFSMRLEFLKKGYQNTMHYLENILKHLVANTKDYPTFANVTSDNKPEVNATDNALNDIAKLFTVDKYSDKLPLSRSLNPFNHLSIKIQSIKLIYQQAIRNFQDVVSYLKNITKLKDTEEKFKPVSVAPNDEVETSTTKTSPTSDGSEVNQPNKNDEKNSSTENTTIVNQLSTISENDVKKTDEEKDESNKESLASFGGIIRPLPNN